MSPMIVFLALFGAAMANPQWGPHGGAPQNWGGAPAPVQDTAEVAAAKAAHYAALSRAGTQPQANQWNSNEDNGQWNGDDGSRWSDNSQQWNQQAQPQQWNQQAQPQQWNQQAQPQWNPNQRWQGPVALPPGFDNNGAPLPVRDTPEVAAEKARHLALATGSPAPGAWNSAPAPSWNAAPNPNWNAAPNWNAPAGGAPADTPEVAAARAAHLAAHQAATGHRWKRSAIALATPLTAHIATPILASPILRTSWSSHLTPIVSHW